MAEGKIINLYNGAQYVEHIDSQVNNYNYYGGQRPEMTEEEQKVSQELKGFFFGDEEEASRFVVAVRGKKPVEVVKVVNQLLKDRKVSDASCGKSMWKVLNDNGMYDATYANWNSQIKV